MSDMRKTVNLKYLFKKMNELILKLKTKYAFFTGIQSNQKLDAISHRNLTENLNKEEIISNYHSGFVNKRRISLIVNHLTICFGHMKNFVLTGMDKYVYHHNFGIFSEALL